MRAALRFAYEGAARIASALTAVVPAGHGKLLDTFAARAGVVARYERFERDSSRPLLWMHAPSVGEGLQARPVLELVRARHPATQTAYTYFSPSAVQFAQALDVDFRDVLPFDSTTDIRAALTALSPTALVFSKLDVWPTLAHEASLRGTRLGLISATLASSSSRASGLAGALLRDAYQRMELVGAISAQDADRLISLGVPAPRVTITGDTRYDQVMQRALSVDRSGALLPPLQSTRPTVVAGSTWPSDEKMLLPAWLKVRKVHGDVRLIIAPHEPTHAHVDAIVEWSDRNDLRAVRLGDSHAGEADVVVVDRTGVLGELYALADIAYVGGAFHAAGLHSVLEPAAYGAPVIFGPRYEASRDASLLLDNDAAIAVTDSDDLARALARWLGDTNDRRTAGVASLTTVKRGLGAAERSFAIVEMLLR